MHNAARPSFRRLEGGEQLGGGGRVVEWERVVSVALLQECVAWFNHGDTRAPGAQVFRQHCACTAAVGKDEPVAGIRCCNRHLLSERVGCARNEDALCRLAIVSRVRNGVRVFEAVAGEHALPRVTGEKWV